MEYIDIHCHLDFPDYDADREEVLSKMRENKIGAITIGADLEGSKKAVEIAEANENIWACIGIHPEYVANKEAEDWIGEFEKLINSKKVVGIGECGLDYFESGKGHLSEENKNLQKELFESQIQFAIKNGKPMMLHIRSSGKNNFDAYEDAIEILKEYKKETGQKLLGNVHFFAGDVLIAKKFLDLGFTMSFTGVITFTSDYDEVLKFIPDNSIMSETDAPFVAPTPFRGKRNEPNYVVEIVKKMAEIRGENQNTLACNMVENAKRVFSL